jgi:hypothetical protein
MHTQNEARRLLDERTRWLTAFRQSQRRLIRETLSSMQLSGEAGGEETPDPDLCLNASLRLPPRLAIHFPGHHSYTNPLIKKAAGVS